MKMVQREGANETKYTLIYIYILISESRCAATLHARYAHTGPLYLNVKSRSCLTTVFGACSAKAEGVYWCKFLFFSPSASFLLHLVSLNISVFGNYVIIIVASVYLWCQYHAMHVTSLSSPNVVNRTFVSSHDGLVIFENLKWRHKSRLVNFNYTVKFGVKSSKHFFSFDFIFSFENCIAGFYCRFEC